MLERGALYVAATPIGNLGDVTERFVHLARRCDCVAAEDTRHSVRLMQHLGLHKPMLAVHEHNEREAAVRVIERLQAGEIVMLVSDAGTPAISDPGARLVDQVLDAGLRVIALPGPSAATAALSIAGLEPGPHVFLGFLPARQSQRLDMLQRWQRAPAAHWVLYEAPHRMLDAAADLLQVCGPQRRVVIARELTKRFEQLVRLPLGDLQPWLRADPNHQRGEFVVIVEAASESAQPAMAASAHTVLSVLLEAMGPSDAARMAARITGLSRKLLYEEAQRLRQGAEREDDDPDGEHAAEVAGDRVVENRANGAEQNAADGALTRGAQTRTKFAADTLSAQAGSAAGLCEPGELPPPRQGGKPRQTPTMRARKSRAR